MKIQTNNTSDLKMVFLILENLNFKMHKIQLKKSSLSIESDECFKMKKFIRFANEFDIDFKIVGHKNIMWRFLLWII